MKSIDEMIAVMQAARDGAVIEYFNKNYKPEWVRVTGLPLWDWHQYDYRVKPITKTVVVYILPRGDVLKALENGTYHLENERSSDSLFTKKVTLTWEE